MVTKKPSKQYSLTKNGIKNSGNYGGMVVRKILKESNRIILLEKTIL